MSAEPVIRTYVAALEAVRGAVARHERGQGLIEYSLLLAFISLACIAVLVLIGAGMHYDFRHIYRILRRHRLF
jgi:Flp pilus assembly pilin Flp